MLIERCDVDFDLTANMHLHVSKELLAENIAIKLLDERGRPKAVKALPVSSLAHWGVEVIEQGHNAEFIMGPPQRQTQCGVLPASHQAVPASNCTTR